MNQYMRGMQVAHQIRSRNNEPIPLEELSAAVPAVAAMTPHESRSDHFVALPTIEMVRGLQLEGFEPFYAAQSGSRIPGKAEFTKHLVRMRHQSLIPSVEEAFEIILINGNDGTSSYQLMSGIFRFFCLNGLFTGDMFANVKVRHTGDAQGQIIEGAYRVLDESERVIEHMGEMKAVDVSADHALDLAIKARDLRWPDTDDRPDIRADLLLPARRTVDQKSDLWTTFNRVQENVISGGVRYENRNSRGQVRRMKTRPIKAIADQRRVNVGLWNEAERILEEVA